MPPKKKAFSLDAFLAEPASKPLNPQTSNKNNKGFHSTNTPDPEPTNSSDKHRNYNSNSHSNSKQRPDNRKYNNRTNESVHLPYWPISLVNSYTLPYSLPLPIHLTKEELYEQFITNASARDAKKEGKESYAKQRFNKNTQPIVDTPVKETDYEFVIDTQMRHIYNYGLAALLDVERGVVLSEPPADVVAQRTAAQKTNHLDPRKVALPAFSKLLPQTPYSRLKELNETVYGVIASDQQDFVDAGPHSLLNATQVDPAAELNAIFDSETTSTTTKTTLTPTDQEVVDFNIPLQLAKHNSPYDSEYPCLVEGELAIMHRDRNSFLHVPGCDYDIMVNAPDLNRAFHGDHVIAKVLYPHQWRVQRVVPMDPEELLVSGGDTTSNSNNQSNDRRNAKRGVKVGDWSAVRQIPEISQFLESKAVQKLIHIEYLRQVDYWYQACRYGVYSMPVQTDDDTTTASNKLADNLFSPKTPSQPTRAAAEQIDNEDEYNTTMGLDKTSTLFGYNEDDVTLLSLFTVTESPVEPHGTKNKQLIEQYLYTKKMWQKYKDRRINALDSEHPLLLRSTPSLVQEPDIDGKIKRIFKPDPTDPLQFKEALFSWYQTLSFRSATSQALSSYCGMISPMTPSSLTGPLPILQSNPSLWYVNFMMALLCSFFPAYQFQPNAAIVSVRNSYGSALKYTLPPISKVFGYWLHDTSLQNQANESKEPTRQQLGYLCDNYIHNCQYNDVHNTHHISLPPPQIGQESTQTSGKGKKGVNPYHNALADRGIVWYRGYNAHLASTTYQFLQDVISTPPTITHDGMIVDTNHPNQALPEEEIGKTNNKKSLYPCLPDNIKSVLLGRDRYFCSTFFSMKITSVAYDIWNTALSFPLEALTTHLYNKDFVSMVKKYKFAVNQVLRCIRERDDIKPLDPSDAVEWNQIQIQVQPQNLRFPAVSLSLSYIIVGDIDDCNVKKYCESTGIIYDAKSKTSPVYLEWLAMKNKNKSSTATPNSAEIAMDDELRNVLGATYTYPSQIMLNIAGVDMQLLSQNAPKLYSWFLCTISRLNSIATFIEQKFQLIEPVMKVKEAELAFSTGKFSATAPKSKKNAFEKVTNELDGKSMEVPEETGSQVERSATASEQLINETVGKELQKLASGDKFQILFLQPHDVQLGDIFGGETQSVGQPSPSKKHDGTKNHDKEWTSVDAKGDKMDKTVSEKIFQNIGQLSDQDHQRIIDQRIIYLSTLDTISVGPTEVLIEKVTKVEPEDGLAVDEAPEGNDDVEYDLADLSIRVIQPTYALTQLESQALSQFIPGLFIIQYTSWHYQAQSPTITVHNESGGSELITSSDKLLPVLIKHKIIQSDVFSPLIETELQNTIAGLSGGTTTPADISTKGEWRVPQEEIRSRADLRQTLIFSIDPLTAKDLDDTLSVEYLGLSTDYPENYFSSIKPSMGPKAIYRLGVHIADVSFFVRSPTLLDQEACNRSTSVYLSTFVIPMLPRLLCEELCSLNQGKDRLAFSCFFLMDEDGNVLDIEHHVRAKHTVRFNNKVDDVNSTHKINSTKVDLDVPVNKNPAKPLYKNDEHKIFKLQDLINPGKPPVNTLKKDHTSLNELHQEFGEDDQPRKYHTDLDGYQTEDEDYIYEENMNDDQEDQLTGQLERLVTDPHSSDVKIRKRGKAHEREAREKARRGEESDDNNLDNEKDGKTQKQNDGKETITPHEAWNKYVTETSWYGKSIIRSALKLDYRTAMLLVECAFQDPMYEQMCAERQQLITTPTEDSEKQQLYNLLQKRSVSQPLSCAEWAALSPLDVTAKIGLHSDSAIQRQIKAHPELSQLFYSPQGRCRPPNYCANYWQEDIYDRSPEELAKSTSGQDLIPEIARACRLLHSLGMKRRQERLTKMGSLTLTRNKLSFKFAYHMDHFFQENPEMAEAVNDYTNGNSSSVPLPLEKDRSVQHYTLYPLHDTNRMIEEYMLLGNEFVAKRIYRILPKHALLRRHPDPDENKLALTTAFLHKLGIPLDTSSAGHLQQSLVSLQQQYDKLVSTKFTANFNPKTADMSKFEEVCFRLHSAGCGVRSIAEEMFAQSMIAAQYFPTGMQQLKKEELVDISKQFGITAPPNDKKNAGQKVSKHQQHQQKRGGKHGRRKEESDDEDDGSVRKGSTLQEISAQSKLKKPNIKDNYQFKWALECEWVKKFKHYALNMGFYTHFTSPIRRYPDIVVHRVLECSLAIEPSCNTLPFSPFYKSELNTTIDDLMNEFVLAQPQQDDASLIQQYSSATRLELDSSVFELVKLVAEITDYKHHSSSSSSSTAALSLQVPKKPIVIKGLSGSLPNAQLYIKTTTPQLLQQQCERFNEQKTLAKYAGDDSSNLTFSELILKRKYQLQWLIDFYHNNYNRYCAVEDEHDDQGFTELSTQSHTLTPLNSIPTAPDSIGIAFAQRFFAIEQPILPNNSTLFEPLPNQPDEVTKYNAILAKYLKSLCTSLHSQYQLNKEAFLTLLTNKCIGENKSPSTNLAVTREYIINFFLKAPILVEKGVILGCTNRSRPGEVAVFLPRTQQTLQIMTDTGKQDKILPHIAHNEPIVGGLNQNIGCTIIQGTYVTSKHSISKTTGISTGFNITGDKDSFLSLLNATYGETNSSTQSAPNDHEEDYSHYDAEFLQNEAEDKALLAKAAGFDRLEKSAKVGDKKINNVNNVDPLVKNNNMSSIGKRNNNYADAIATMDTDSMWLINWDPMFYSLAWFDWSPIIDMSTKLIPHNSLTLEDCTLCLPHYIHNGVWDSFFTQNKDRVVFFPFQKKSEEQPQPKPQVAHNTLGFIDQDETGFTFDNTDEEKQQKNVPITSISEFSQYTEGIRLFDTVRVVLLPQIPELTFKPILIPNAVAVKK